MTTKDTIRYFDSRGKAEPIRMLYVLAGESYVDERIDNDDWLPKYKKGSDFYIFNSQHVNKEMSALLVT